MPRGLRGGSTNLSIDLPGRNVSARMSSCVFVERLCTLPLVGHDRVKSLTIETNRECKIDFRVIVSSLRNTIHAVEQNKNKNKEKIFHHFFGFFEIFLTDSAALRAIFL